MLLTARDVMKTDLISIPTRATLREAARIMEEEGIHGAPVVDLAGRVIGIVSRSDLVSELTDDIDPNAPVAGSLPDLSEEGADEDATEEEEEEIDRIEDDSGSEEEDAVALEPSEPIPAAALDEDKTVEDVMSPRVVTVEPEATVGEVAQVMRREGIHRVLVVEGDETLGIVSATDLLDCLQEYERTIRSAS